MILQLDLPHICRLDLAGSSSTINSKPKRQRVAPKNTLSTSPLDFVIPATEPVVPIVNRTISITGECPIDLTAQHGIQRLFFDGSSEVREFYSKSIKLSLDPQAPVLEVYSTRVGKLAGGLILSLNLLPQYVPSEIAAELAVVNTTTKKLRANGILLAYPTIRLIFNSVLNTLQTTIEYSISLRSAVESPCQPDVISRLNALIYSRFKRSSHTDLESPATTQSFYNAISSHTATHKAVDYPLAPKGLSVQLMPFQQKTTNWLLNMEGLEWSESKADFIRQPLVTDDDAIFLRDFSRNVGTINEMDAENRLVSMLNRLTYGWEVVVTENLATESTRLLYNPFTANLISFEYACNWLLCDEDSESARNRRRYIPAQGLLAEEMGLGKTVEIAGLICANPRPRNEIDKEIKIQLKTFGDLKTVHQAKTTLVIAPESILSQWMEEMGHLAPGLRVCLYGGINAYPKLSNLAPLIAKYLRNFDVVFTTYATISAELDYALFTVNAKNTRSSLQRLLSKQNHADEAEEGDPEHEDIDDYQPTALQQFDNPYQAKASLKTKPQTLSKRMRAILAAQSEFETNLQEEIAREAAANDEYRSHRYNVQSPLIFTQFWRVVLDEVQMVSSSFSRAFKVAALIPRFHAWGVSGTPIKRGIDDLQSILQFLRYSPFCGDIGKGSWRRLVANRALFDKLWTSICFRHTKSMVHREIQLPAQNRILLSIPFSRIEQDYYLQIFHECLAAIGLDIEGHPAHNDWEPSPFVLLLMKTWLIRLRQICCSPQIGKVDSFGRRNKRGTSLTDQFALISGIKTLESLLEEMKLESYRNISSLERAIVSLLLARGEFLEFIYEPLTAEGYLLEGAKLTEQKLSYLKLIQATLLADLEQIADGENETLESDRIRNLLRDINTSKRSWDLTLHRLYFMIASCFFQQADPEYSNDREKFRLRRQSLRQYMAEWVPSVASPSNGNTICGSELVSEMYGLKASRLDEYAEMQAKCRMESDMRETLHEKEVRYYALAESIRQELLKTSIANVEGAINSKLKDRGWSQGDWKPQSDDGSKLFAKSMKRVSRGVIMIEEMSFSDLATTMATKMNLEKVEGIFSILNRQAALINHWMNDLLQLLNNKMVSHDKSLSGDEYEESLQDQTKISAYLFILEQAITDRGMLINEPSVSGISSNKTTTVIKKDAGNEDSNENEFETSLRSSWTEVNPKMKYSLQSILAEFEAELNDRSSSHVVPQIPIDLMKALSNICANQKQSCLSLRNELKSHCNTIFNTRIEYFKQLQQISDSVKTQAYGMSRDGLEEGPVRKRLQEQTREQTRLREQLDRAVAKFRYLKTLDGGDTGDGGESVVEISCIICRSNITIGSLTHCGHRYCKECLDEWLKTSKSCPICKAVVTGSSVHQFSHYKPDLKATKVHERKDRDTVSGDHLIYQPLPESSIKDVQNIKLPASYSSKIDLIVRQTLSLKHEDPAVKIVVFSQWQDMLYLVGSAFKASGITYVASHGTVVPDFSTKGRKLCATRNKFDSVEQFKDPLQDITCFFLNAKAQASGLTLVNATHIILCEPLVNTALELQAISRIHRIGQHKATTVWMVAIENTVEESIVATSNMKRLQYAGDKEGVHNKACDQSTSVDTRSEELLSEIDSITLMNSGGGDLLVEKGSGQGELVTNDDLWSAFFGAKNNAVDINSRFK